jgi:glycosyltransferase involved in cell wall biosynthesis
MSSVDVIVPCYRYGHFLRECVESVLKQSFRNVRVLILDDASPDNTAEVGAELAREDSRVTLVRHNVNKGHIATYNEGIDWVSAHYMLLLSADDYLLPGALDRAAALLDSHPDVGFVFGRAVELGSSGTNTQTGSIAGYEAESSARVLTGIQFIELSGPHNIVPTPTAVVRTTLQKRLGGYCIDLPHAGDMEMWLRLAANASVGILDAHLAVYRRHADNMSHAYLTKNRIPDLEQRKAALDRFGQYCGDTLKSGAALHRRLLSLLGRDAIGYASAAFNDDDMDACRKLSAFARDVCPDVENSWPWIKLACKRRMGIERWRAVQPVVAGLRQRALSMKTKTT